MSIFKVLPALGRCPLPVFGLFLPNYWDLTFTGFSVNIVMSGLWLVISALASESRL